jgi:uncharacterized phage-associated protein
MTISTFQAAKTICNLSNWTISNLPLQKLLYLAHMYHLGEYNEPLITGQFEAWDLGPVEPSLYHKIKAYGNQPIVDIFYCAILDNNSNEFKSLETVYKQFKDSPPGKLVSITHDDNGAWALNYKPNIHGLIISNEDILNEYKYRTKQFNV